MIVGSGTVLRLAYLLGWLAAASTLLVAQTTSLSSPSVTTLTLTHAGAITEVSVPPTALADELSGCGTNFSEPLPLMPTELTATRETATTVHLSWLTQVSDYDYAWTLQRRLDTEEPFTTIQPLSSAQIAARNYTDRNDHHGVSYYRLRGETADGVALISRVVSVDNPFEVSGLRVYPNPLRGMAKVQLPGTRRAFTLQLYDSLGRRVWSGQYAAGAGNPVDLPFPDLPHGVYQLQWLVDDEVRDTERVVVSR
ncbi:MAG: T9SS type A sorting domain-containing protein [Lewinella sp.]